MSTSQTIRKVFLDTPDAVSNAVLFYEWCEGPGREYPSHIEMVPHTTCGPLKEVRAWDDGWEDEFRAWAASKAVA